MRKGWLNRENRSCYVGIEWRNWSFVNIVSLAKPAEPNSMFDSREQKVPSIMFMLTSFVNKKLWHMMYFLYHLITWLIWINGNVMWVILVQMLGVDVRLCKVWLICVGTVRFWDWPKTYFSKTMILDLLTIGSPSNFCCRLTTYICTFWSLGFAE